MWWCLVPFLSYLGLASGDLWQIIPMAGPLNAMDNCGIGEGREGGGQSQPVLLVAAVV